MLQQRDGARCAAHVSEVIRRRYDEIVDVIRTGIADIYVGPATDRA
jgi:hypothetical protein